MKQLLSLLLILTMTLSLTACEMRSSEERQLMRSQMDYAKNAPAADSFDYALDDGTRLEADEIYNEHGLSITLLGIYETDDSYILPIRLHNTSRNWFNVYSNQCFINGWQVSNSFYKQVCPDGMADTQLMLYKSDYPELFGPVGEIVLGIDCSTEGSNGYYDFDYTISLREIPEFTPDVIPIMERDGALCSLLDCRVDDWSISLDLVVINDSGRAFSLGTSDAHPVINGTESSFSCWESVWLEDGEKSIMDMELYWYELEEDGIDDLSDIETFSIDLEFYRNGKTDYYTLELDGETIQELADN